VVDFVLLWLLRVYIVLSVSLTHVLECLSQIASIKEEMDARGGIRVYQDACVFDYRYRKDTPHKWIVRKMEEHNIRPEVVVVDFLLFFFFLFFFLLID
jgi:hypothetical protein